MRPLLLGLALLACASATHAEPLSYDYVYLSHQETETDTSMGRAGSDVFGMHYEVGKHLHVFGSLGDAGAYGNPLWKNMEGHSGLEATVRWYY